MNFDVLKNGIQEKVGLDLEIQAWKFLGGKENGVVFWTIKLNYDSVYYIAHYGKMPLINVDNI